jgi:hydroxyacylglutathione hydrolase
MKIITLPCSFDNYAYLIVCEETGNAAVVDPAEFYPVFCEVEKRGITLRSVFCTHHHADHISGLEDLLGELPDLNVYGYKGDENRIPGMNCSVKDGDLVRFGKISGKVLHTPGHTTGSLCYIFDGSIFTGDTLFSAGCGRLFEGTAEEMYHALNVKIKEMVPETKVYFGHEYTAHNLKYANFVDPDNKNVLQRTRDVAGLREERKPTSPTTLKIERETNPFLRCDKQGIIKTVAEKFIGEQLDPLAVFTVLRRLRDSF